MARGEQRHVLPSLDNPFQARLIADRVAKAGQVANDDGDTAMAEMLVNFAREIKALHGQRPEQKAATNGHEPEPQHQF